MISWPSLRSSSIFGSGPFSRSRSPRAGPGGPEFDRSRRRRGSMGDLVAVRRRRRPRARRCRRCPSRRELLVLFGLEAVEFLEGGDDVGYVEEAVTFEPKIDEGRLHAGQHFRDPALVDVANHAARSLALDEDLGDLVVLEYRDPCFVGARGDDHLLAHARRSERVLDAAGSRQRTPAPQNAGASRARIWKQRRISWTMSGIVDPARATGCGSGLRS